jgi:signal transduction histidine kinase
MGPQQRAQALLPFFTTKERCVGTGLGLSAVYGTVRQAGGDLKLASEPGRGTRVELWLPQAADGSISE